MIARAETGAAAADHGIHTRVVRAASLLTIFFDDDPRFARFFQAMLAEGILLPPSPQEAWFVSAAHGRAELDGTLEAAHSAFTRLGELDA